MILGHTYGAPSVSILDVLWNVPTVVTITYLIAFLAWSKASSSPLACYVAIIFTTAGVFAS